MRNNIVFSRFFLTLGMALGLSIPAFAFAATAPSITSITPTSGTASGGTSITISGSHLDNVAVTIGGTAATSVVIAANGQSLTAVTPSGTVGSQDVVVSNTNGTSTLSAGFTFTTPPASCNGSTFDTFNTGSVNGQGNWRVSSDVDQEVAPNTFGYSTFGCKTLRISDATTSVFIYNQIFSASTTNAGEYSALDDNAATGTSNNHFEGQFDLASVTQNEQPGMHLSVSPDRGDGTRMSSLGFVDTSSGIDVYFDDVTGTSTSANFNETQIATALSRSVPHTIKFAMDFLEGASNDVVKVYIDGNLVHTGTSWENYYRYDSSVFGGPTPNNSRTVNSLVFYEPNPAHTADKFNGYLIDNVSLSSSVVSTSTNATSTSSSSLPVITLNGSSTMNIDLNSTWTDPGATAVDASNTPLTVTATGTVNTAATGTYSIMYSATDSSNQTATTSRTVNVVATSTSATSTATTSIPTITLNGSSTVQILQNGTWTDPGATASDTASSSLTVTATGTVDTSTLGNYTILYSATGTNNAVATTTRTVQVVGSISTSTPGSGGGGGTTSGGGYFIYSPQTSGNGQITVTPVTTVGSNPVTVTLIPTTGQGQVLGVSTYNFGRNLKVGMTGDDILALQTLLKTGGYLVINVPTNYFGGKTLAALKKWQKAHKLPATGFFGPMSRALLNNS